MSSSGFPVLSRTEGGRGGGRAVRNTRIRPFIKFFFIFPYFYRPCRVAPGARYLLSLLSRQCPFIPSGFLRLCLAVSSMRTGACLGLGRGENGISDVLAGNLPDISGVKKKLELRISRRLINCANYLHHLPFFLNSFAWLTNAEIKETCYSKKNLSFSFLANRFLAQKFFPSVSNSAKTANFLLFSCACAFSRQKARQ